MSKKSETQQHLIRIRPVTVVDAPDGVKERYSAKDLLSGVGAGGATEEEARKRVMDYYSTFPDKLPGKGEIGPGPATARATARNVRGSPCS